MATAHRAREMFGAAPDLVILTRLGHGRRDAGRLGDDESCRAGGFADPPDRVARLAALVDAYEPTPADRRALPDLIVLRLRATRDGIRAGAARGEPALVRLVRIGVDTGVQRQLDRIHAHEPDIRRATTPTWRPAGRSIPPTTGNASTSASHSPGRRRQG